MDFFFIVNRNAEHLCETEQLISIKHLLAEFCFVLLTREISAVPNLIFSAQTWFYQRK